MFVCVWACFSWCEIYGGSDAIKLDSKNWRRSLKGVASSKFVVACDKLGGGAWCGGKVVHRVPSNNSVHVRRVLSITLGTHEVVFDSELESELCVDYVASTNAGHVYAPMNCTSD